MKKITLLGLLMLACAALRGQSFDYGNSWYRNDPNRTYIKLVVAEDGLYRVSSQDLQSAGYDLSAVDARTLRLFYRGRETPMFISRNGTQLVYLEFFGRRNDGRLDSVMYRNPQIPYTHHPDLQPNKRYSLFTDSSAYFLTWGSTPSSSRYFSIYDPTYSTLTPESVIPFETFREYGYRTGGTYVRGGGGATDETYTLNSDYVTGEGYQGPDFSLTQAATVSLNTPFAANLGNPATIRMRVFGRSNTQHALRVLLNGNNAQLLLDTTLAPRVYTKTYTRTSTANLSNRTDLTFQAYRNAPRPDDTDNNNVSWASIRYERLPNLGGDSAIYLTGWSKDTKAYLRLEDVKGRDTVFAYDFVNRTRFKGVITIQGGKKIANVILLGFPNTRDIYVATDSAIHKPLIQPASLNNLSNPAAGAEYVIIAHRSLSASAQAYAYYRDTAQVSPLASTKVVYTDEIYDEFGWGSITPWAIKRFCKYALDNWQVKPRFFLLWGKGRYELRATPSEPMVPTYGYPATDYEFVGHFDQNSSLVRPEAAIGRVSIFTDQQGLDFLEKVKEYEHSPWDAWMKNGVFLGGGETLPEQNQISSAMNFMIDIYNSPPLGGQENYFQKNSASVVIDPASASYHDWINQGAGLIHFFGHSTANIFDISLRQPAEYTNFGRYPVMVAMGCYGGDFTASGTTFGEGWIRQPGRGAIAYVANSSAGYLFPLRDYGRILYQRLYNNLLGEPLGITLQSTLTKYQDSIPGIQTLNHGRQMNLQGDPALRLYTPSNPDLAIENSGIFFTPDNFTAQSDSFGINVIIANLGLSVRDSFRITVRQRLPDGRTVDHPSRDVVVTAYSDTISWTLTNPAVDEIAGLNLFEVRVDALDSIAELREDNNFVALSKVIPGNIPAILYPLEYAIVGEEQIELKASSFFMTRDDDVGYVFEIDTTDQFNSPQRINSGVIRGRATLASWPVPFSLKDSAVYYWRVRLAEADGEVWANASFKYIDSRNGWAQADFPQFKRDQTQRIQLNELQQEMTFQQLGAAYEFFTSKNGVFVYSLNGSLVEDACLNGFCGNGVVYTIIDQYTLRPVIQQYFFRNMGTAAAPNELYKLRDAIFNAREGDYIIVGSNRNPRVPLWSEDIFDALKQIGVSDNIRYLQDGDAFIVMGRKGYSSGAVEVYSANSPPKYLISTLLLTSYDDGFIYSPRIGPSLSWDKLFWNWRSTDAVVREDARVSVIGIRRDGSESVLLDSLGRGEYSLSAFSAAEFPYVRLRAHLQDTTTRTAPQLDNWHVIYTPAPDAVVDPFTNFSFQADTVFEGENISLRMAAQNISPTPMDSLAVRLRVERRDRSFLELDTLRIAAPAPQGAPVSFQYSFNTANKSLDGAASLIVELNPGPEQDEQYLFNNLYVQPFYVKVDRANPVLDVTFDGKHILDGDIVSPRPEILIEVNDENPLVALDDSSAFELYFKPGTSAATSFERVFIASDPRADWRPASLPENKARLYFYPGQQAPLEDGEYTLRVQGKDKKGNVAGRGDNFYEIRFSVENASTVTHVLNYPNPFSTSTRFVYTLTGAEIPEVFQIHIYTISGKMVKVIDLKETGDVQIGRNITEYAWDGTDEYGDRLANGVYLYKVITRMQGESGLELRETGTGQYFNNGWGKMYILR